MSWLKLIYTRLYGFLRRGRVESEMDEELRFYIHMRMQENILRGMTPDQARRDAERRFGNFEHIKDLCRDVRGGGMLDTLWQDVRFGSRMLVRSRAVTIVAVLALALGIGANTAIFSVVNSVLLKPLPYKSSERLVMVWEDATKYGFAHNTPAPANFIDWREQGEAFEDMAALIDQSFNLTDVGEPERIEGQRVSASLFPLLGVEPVLGRAFLPEEDRPEGNRVVILSHGLWRRRFGLDENIIGKTLNLNAELFTVVGVMPPAFQFPDPEDELWVPVAFSPDEASNRGSHYLRVVARLKPDVTLGQAQAEMDTIAARLEQQYPQSNTSVGAVVVSLQEELVGDIRPALLVLLGAVGFVLLIACANVANLLLARAAARQKETAIRTALGAGRLRLMRQFLTESILLAGLGGAVGLMLAVWGIDLIVRFIPGNIWQAKSVSFNMSVLGFTLLVSLVTGVVFGLAPALQASRTNLNESLKEGGRDSATGARGSRVRKLLVVSEIALALVLLIGAGLMINSFTRLRNVDAGFQPDNLLTMRIILTPSKYPDQTRRAAFFTELLSRVKALPGVQDAGAISWLPLTFKGGSNGFTIEGRPEPPRDQLPISIVRVISPDYFRTMSIPLLKGRAFTEQDTQDSPGVVIINEAMAKHFWPGEEAIEKRIKMGGFNSEAPWLSVVGIAKNVRQYELNTESKPEMYFPYIQANVSGSAAFGMRDLVVRTSTDPLGLAAAARSEVWAVDKDQPVSNIRTMEQIMSTSVSRQRFNMLLLGIFAAVALILAAVGIYGVMSYSVAQRTHELGIRMALGAQSRDVLGLVIGQGMKLTLIGIATGLAAAFALTRLMSSLLYGVSATDPLTFAAISVILTGVALAASFVPARRAIKVDPIVALRYE
jgi:predicted permease